MPHVPPPPPSTAAPCGPSPGLLSLLARITPTAPPHTPPTPDFLCPITAHPLPRRRRPRALQQAHHTQQHPSASSSSATTSLPVPVKYEQSRDGKWYPAVSWSLHGKTKVPQGPQPTATPVAIISRPDLVESAAADRLQNVSTTTAPTTTATAASSQNTDITDSLPTGWKPGPSRTKFYDIPMIVIVSLILAIFVTLFITGCVLGHNARSTAHDLERAKRPRTGADRDPHPDDIGEYEAGAPAVRSRRHHRRQRSSDSLAPSPSSRAGTAAAAKKDKLWERWRRQAKAGLRRRRRWRHVGAHGTADEHAEQQPQHLQRESRGHDPQPSYTQQPHVAISIPSPPLQPASPPSHPPQPHTSSSPPTASSPSLPPAYRRISRVRRSCGRVPESGEWVIESLREADGAARSPRQEHEDGGGLYEGEGERSVPVKAHVATDDKAVLEQMRRQASEPWEGHDAHGSGVMSADGEEDGEEGQREMRARVPVWEDERLEDFEEISLDGEGCQDEDDVAGPSSRPSGPAKEASLNPHPHAYDHHSPLRLPLPPQPTQTYRMYSRRRRRDLDLDEVAFGLPFYVPRFEVGPSAPPVVEGESEGVRAGPSAPPLEGEEAVMEGCVPDLEEEGVGGPSAPPMEDEDEDGDTRQRSASASAPSLDLLDGEERGGSPEDRDWDAPALQRGHVPWSPSGQRTLSMSGSPMQLGSETDVRAGGAGTASHARSCSTAANMNHAVLPRYEP